MLCALIMAGGQGTRFWPLSTENKPKQFLKLLGNETMIQMTVNRIRPIIPIDNIFVCTIEKYKDLVKEQLPDLPERNIILEPEGRNTAPCIALSSLVIDRYYKDAHMLVLPADHLIGDENGFLNIVNKAEKFLDKNKQAIITLGMKADRAETGYGYIKYDKNKKCYDEGLFKVERFVEKPNKEKAEQYFKDQSYLWNGGIFLWNIASILSEIKKYSSSTFEAIKNISYVDENELQKFINESYCKTEKISIDYAVLEKSENIYVFPSDIKWDDIGTWEAIERYKEKDCHNNIIVGNTEVIESHSNISINYKKPIVMIGMEDTMAVETEESIYVINKKYVDKLRTYKEILEKDKNEFI